MTPEGRGPACGLPVVPLPVFQAHLRAIAGDEQHTATLYTPLGITYAALQADERATFLERARARG